MIFVDSCNKTLQEILSIAETSITSLKAVVHGIIAGIPVPFSLPEPEACGKSLKCPVASGTKVFYHEGLPVKTQYPSVSWGPEGGTFLELIILIYYYPNLLLLLS